MRRNTRASARRKTARPKAKDNAGIQMSIIQIDGGSNKEVANRM